MIQEHSYLVVIKKDGFNRYSPIKVKARNLANAKFVAGCHVRFDFNDPYYHTYNYYPLTIPVGNQFADIIKEIENTPGFVYLIRTCDIYKIGITMCFEKRMKQLEPDEVIATKQAANTRGIERLLHKRYEHCRIPQTEYFRLTDAEVDEVSNILQPGKRKPTRQAADTGIQEIREAIESRTPKPLSYEYTEIRSHSAKALSDLQRIFDAAEVDGVLWGEIEASTGIKANLIDLILRTEGTDTRLPRSNELLGALERMKFREDALRPIAQLESLEQLARDSYRILLDCCLIYCWSIRYGYVKIHDRHSGGRSEVLEFMEEHLRSAGIWYTFSRTAMSAWSVDGISAIVMAIAAVGAVLVLGIVVAVLSSLYLDMQRKPRSPHLLENPGRLR